MYVVPREFDGNFDKDGAYEHLQVLTEGGLKGQQFLHFPLDGIQPLPGGPGSLMCWYGNCIHWGSACHSTGKHDPRASIALVFRCADAFHGFDSPCLRRRCVPSLPPSLPPCITPPCSPRYLQHSCVCAWAADMRPPQRRRAHLHAPASRVDRGRNGLLPALVQRARPSFLAYQRGAVLWQGERRLRPPNATPPLPLSFS